MTNMAGQTAIRKWTDHGIPVMADEARTAAVCINEKGESRFVIAARGYLLIVNTETGKCTQMPFPGGLIDYPFGCLSSSNGLFYTAAGPLFMVLDPFAEAYVYYCEPEPGEEIAGFGFAEGRDGVYAATYPRCRLFKYDPENRTITSYGSLDEREMYPIYMAVDRFGWVYAGIGTERKNIVAFHPQTGEKKSLVPDTERAAGAGYVHLGSDGHVYGHHGSEMLRAEGDPKSYNWKRFVQGEAFPVEYSDVAPSDFEGIGFHKIHGKLPGSKQIEEFNLAEKELFLYDSEQRRREKIQLYYSSEGANLSPLVAGPDGNVYGTSNHPLHFFSYNPQEDKLVNYGGRAVELGGGGNICAYAVQGKWIAGAAYAGGFFHLFDTTKPVILDSPEQRNPKLVARHEEIHRPRCAVAHPDGEHVIYGGFAGYGVVGGALGIYNVHTNEDIVIPNDAIVPFQSTLSLVVLNNGDVLGGTSIEAPGGAVPKANEAVLYRMDWRSKRVIECITPIPGARGISLMIADSQQRIHALTAESHYFVYDPESGQVLTRQDVSEYGEVVRDGLTSGPDGRIYGALSNTLFSIDTVSCRVIPLTQAPEPITSGIALVANRLYVGCGSHLWSYDLEEREGE